MIAGRKIVCSLCAGKTVKGTTRVCRRIVFHFCPDCWTRQRPECTAFMTGVSDIPEAARKAA